MNAIMPSMGSRGMSGIGAPPIQSPAQNPQGRSPDNMGQIMAMARKMSDMQLADVLSGKNMNVPQFAAMTEAMGRKSLRTAMQGAQAQGQLQKPNLKQQTLADLEAQQAPQMAPAPQMQQQSFMAAEGGLASLPAPNMDSMDMAEGGIVAFAEPSNKQEVKDPNLTEEEKARLEQNDYMKRVQAISNPGEAISKWWNERPSSNELWKRGQQARTGEIPAFVGTEPTVKGNLVNQGLVSSDTPIPDVKKVATANALKATAPTVYDVEDARAGMPAALSAKQASAAPSTTGAAPSATPQTTTDLKFQKRANPFGELNAEVPDYAKVKSNFPQLCFLHLILQQLCLKGCHYWQLHQGQLVKKWRILRKTIKHNNLMLLKLMNFLSKVKKTLDLNTLHKAKIMLWIFKKLWRQ